ncbi:MAG: FHA domain-containing protein, partial [Anaerolineae bacterium]
RDLRHSARRRQVAPPKGKLVVVDAANTGLEPGLAFPLQEVTPLGRTSANAIALPDPFVSTHHALLAWRQARWWLEDLNSRNGTTLNGEPVTRPVVVSGGDLIGVGRVTLRLEVEG